ncbi:hypothetical protein GCK72_025156 [Caenorhabditis remanei]|nr:hypothetical protein GCK72_025156 [Caenorhabditis remanei]KAF1748689.1 hypothetical protein GCK72_025156 [Caenorhabditis remanei]
MPFDSSSRPSQKVISFRRHSAPSSLKNGYRMNQEEPRISQRERRRIETMSGVQLLKYVALELGFPEFEKIMPSVEYVFERLCYTQQIGVPNPRNSYFFHFATMYIKSRQPLLMPWEEDLKLFKSTAFVKNNHEEWKKTHPQPILIDMMPNDPEKKKKEKKSTKRAISSDSETDGLTEIKSNPASPTDNLEFKRQCIMNKLKNVRETHLNKRTPSNLHQVLQQFKSKMY